MEGESLLDRYRRKANQAYELAGCARADGDKDDEARWLEEAKRLEQLIEEAK